MIQNGKGCHYHAVTKLSALLKELNHKTLNHNSDFCCLNCLHSFTIKNKLEQHKNVCENKEFYGVGMPCQKI